MNIRAWVRDFGSLSHSQHCIYQFLTHGYCKKEKNKQQVTISMISIHEFSYRVNEIVIRSEISKYKSLSTTIRQRCPSPVTASAPNTPASLLSCSTHFCQSRHASIMHSDTWFQSYYLVSAFITGAPVSHVPSWLLHPLDTLRQSKFTSNADEELNSLPGRVQLFLITYYFQLATKEHYIDIWFLSFLPLSHTQHIPLRSLCTSLIHSHITLRFSCTSL